MSDNTNNGFPVPEEPLTRIEQYLSAIAGVTSSSDIPEEPLTRIEAYLDMIVKNGGGGGTSDYTQLANKPKINNVELDGNKSSSDLGLQDTVAFEGTYNSSSNKAATMADIKDGKLTGYEKKSGNVAAADKIIEAIGKVEKKADDNQSNILTVEQMNGQKNHFDNKAVSKTVDNLTFVVNDDKSITVSGSNTTAGNIVLYLSSATFEYITNNNIGRYLMCMTDGSSSSYRLSVVYSNTGTSYATEAYQDNSPLKIANYPYYEIQLIIAAGYTFTEPKTFYPMIIDGTVLNAGFTDYQPYAMTNAELTAAIQAIQAQLANT